MDRRVRRTRTAVLGAFARLALERRYEQIRTADLVAEAGIGRSTFYEHFRGKDDVLLAAMAPLLLTLANAAVGRASPPQLRATLNHLWAQRSPGRAILTSRTMPSLRRELASLIESRLIAEPRPRVPPAMIAMAAAAGQLAMLRMWLSGEASCTADDLARQMIAQAAPVRDISKTNSRVSTANSDELRTRTRAVQDIAPD